MFNGWFAERLAREEKLGAPAGYIEQFLDGNTDPDLAAAMAEAELSRMALQWGLEIEDLGEGG